MLERNSAACAALTIALTLALSGCGVWQTASDSTVAAYDTVFHNRGRSLSVDLTAVAALNQDNAGHPRSVAVRVYQLKDRKRFDGASYDELLGNDRTLLREDLLSNVASVVNPGASSSLSQPMQRETKFVAIAAFYRDAATDGSWKRVIPANKLSDDEPLKLMLADRTLMPADDSKAAKAK